MSETDILWLGTQASYEVFKAAQQALVAKAAMEDAPKQKELPWALDVQGNVGVVNITGSLVDGYAGWGRYYGETGYGDIRDALAAAVSHPGVGSILLNVSSGGGQVAGVHETAQLIQRVNKVKPVVTYTGSTMASAALWLGTSARKVFASQTAEVGSIGILMMHADKSKMLADAGIKVTVIRAGKEKALATPYEPLSAKAEEVLQARANALYDIFIGHVAASRGTTITAADAKFGQGRVFLGQQAFEAGLVDQVGSLEDAVAHAEKLSNKTLTPKSVVNPQQNGMVRAIPGAGKLAQESPRLDFANNAVSALSASDVTQQKMYSSVIASLEGTSNMSKSLSDEQLAAMAAGVDLNASAEDSVEPAEKPAAKVDTPPAPEASTPAPSAVDVIKEMLAQAQTDLVTVKAEAVTLKAQLAAKGTEIEAIKADTDKFVEIARASVKTMGLHFGLTSETVAAMKPNDVLAEHARLSDLFKAKFKAGGVAATTSESAKPKQAVPLVFAAMSNQAK